MAEEKQQMAPIFDINGASVAHGFHGEKLPPHIYANRSFCGNYHRFMQQTRVELGFIPLTDLKLYQGPEKHWRVVPDLIQAHKMVRSSGVPNFLSCRIPVQGPLRPQVWRAYLHDYWDQQLTDLIEFGFPLDFKRMYPLQSTMDNHTSANDHVTAVEKYLSTELQHGALLGPFSEPPFPINVSPLMTRPKSDSAKRRTIVDLSGPKQCSVNTGVNRHMYLDTYFKLQYPSVDHITNTLIQLGPGAMLYKVDISRAFRHLRIDPGDIDFLGLKYKDFFLDVTLPFGFCHGLTFFTRCSDAIRHIIRQHGFPGFWTYIDDLICTGLPSKINQSYTFLLHLLQQLGLDISMEKLVSPTTSAIWYSG